jgi:dTDP-4-amino-4,6-dideoxygalactose transaminase
MPPDAVATPLLQGREPFVVRRDPRLEAHMLSPLTSRRRLPPPLDPSRTIHLFWARNAVYHGLAVLGIRPGDTVLVPAFHCTSVVEPILQYGARVTFYNVHRDCSPDFRDIRAKIGPGTRAIIAIHYFGFPQPMREFRAIADEHGVALIEDCAHAFGGQHDGVPLGSIGDVAIFSVRKFLPVYDGGQLVVNNQAIPTRPRLTRPSRLFRLRVLANTVEKLIADASTPGVRSLYRLFRAFSATARCLIAQSGKHPVSLTLDTYTAEFNPTFVDMPMSALSRRILETADVDAVVIARRRNYRLLEEALREIGDVHSFFADLPVGVCPWVLPVLVNGWTDFHRHLRARGIPAFTWSDVVHRDLPIDDFPDAAFMYQRLVLLPIHQSLMPTDIARIAAAVADVLGTDR